MRKKVKRAQEELLDVVLEYYKNRESNETFGAQILSNEVGLIAEHKFNFAHALLVKLETRGQLEHIDGKGFRLPITKNRD